MKGTPPTEEEGFPGSFLSSRPLTHPTHSGPQSKEGHRVLIGDLGSQCVLRFNQNPGLETGETDVHALRNTSRFCFKSEEEKPENLR